MHISDICSQMGTFPPLFGTLHTSFPRIHSLDLGNLIRIKNLVCMLCSNRHLRRIYSENRKRKHMTMDLCKFFGKMSPFLYTPGCTRCRCLDMDTHSMCLNAHTFYNLLRSTLYRSQLCLKSKIPLDIHPHILSNNLDYQDDTLCSFEHCRQRPNL